MNKFMQFNNNLTIIDSGKKNNILSEKIKKYENEEKKGMQSIYSSEKAANYVKLMEKNKLKN